MKQPGSKYLCTFITAIALAAVSAAPSLAQRGPEATAEKVATLHAMADWTGEIVDRLQRNGKTVAGESTRELHAIRGQLIRFDRIGRSGDPQQVVRRREVEELADRLAQVWLDVRRSAQGLEVDDAPMPAAAAPASLTTIPRGTNVTVELTTWLSSKSASVGDRFSVLVAAPIYVGGQIGVPSGSVMEGLVTAVDRAGRVSDAGNLHIYIDRLRGPQGQIADLRGIVVGLASGDDIKGKGVSAGKTAAGAAVGGLLGGLLEGKKGALIGLGVGAGGTLLAEKGKDVDLPQGSLLRVEIQDSVSFSWSWQQQ